MVALGTGFIFSIPSHKNEFSEQELLYIWEDSHSHQHIQTTVQHTHIEIIYNIIYDIRYEIIYKLWIYRAIYIALHAV